MDIDIEALLAAAPPLPEPPTFPELPEDPREAFAALLAFRRTLNVIGQANDAFEARRDAVLRPAYKALFKHRKFIMAEAMAEFPELCDHFETEAEAVVGGWRSLEKAADAKLNELAAGIEPQPGTEWNRADVVNSTSYNTQGFGAHSYARGAAESYVPHYVQNGLKAKVEVHRWDDRPDYKPLYGKRSDIADYVVMVKADALDIEIAKHRPGMTTREWVKWCWGNGKNPRVFQPMLPQGYEEAHGLDYFGGEVFS